MPTKQHFILFQVLSLVAREISFMVTVARTFNFFHRECVFLFCFSLFFFQFFCHFQVLQFVLEVHPCQGLDSWSRFIVTLSASQTNNSVTGGVSVGGGGSLKRPQMVLLRKVIFRERVELTDANVLPFLAECRLRLISQILSFQCASHMSVPVLGFLKQSNTGNNLFCRASRLLELKTHTPVLLILATKVHYPNIIHRPLQTWLNNAYILLKKKNIPTRCYTLFPALTTRQTETRGERPLSASDVFPITHALAFP